ncbi:ribonuclease P protein component [Roseiarcaceae bacterium H3SJ34-1]|uniref:ribonuclease P protein component n=1 Tax=Terripilifer ovatus TaxID=3032367 RepID=UPI003AB9360A|nr:ribonuclease P protein component [Roseiarcaceae bacterium H3SJ34-1]
MTVSHTSGAGNDRPGATQNAMAPAHAVSPTRIGRLHKRSQYLRVAKGARFHTKGFSLQSGQAERVSGEQASDVSHFGFTVTRKVGTAVERNRMRRRLREALRLAPDLASKPGHDYVILARREALYLPFAGLIRDLQTAIVRIGAKDGRKQPK